MDVKKVLLFTGKFPSSGKDIDGGSIMIGSLINALKNKVVLDVVFTRTFNTLYAQIEGVNNIWFETYKNRIENKFLRRLINENQLFDCLKNKIKDYDLVIITHCSKAFGVEKLSIEERRKIILFPMYLSPSYIRSGEKPPIEYINKEKLCLRAVNKILTPSNSEKDDMVNEYNVDANKIRVIPRGYTKFIKPNVKKINNEIKIIYIASIKEQKNTIDAIILIDELIKTGLNVKLFLVGSVQDPVIKFQCDNYIIKNKLENNIEFVGIVSQEELAVLIKQMHFNISVSNWETYGRGIYEGMAGGLPTIIYEHLDCVKEYLNNEEGIFFVKDRKQMQKKIINLLNNEKEYLNQAQLAINSVEYLSEANENERLIKEILQ